MVESVRDALFRLYPGLAEDPQGDEWEAIKDLVGPDVQWSVWFIANRALGRHRHSKDYASPASQRKDAIRLEKAASQLRDLLSRPFIHELARAHVYGERPLRLSFDETQPIILKPAGPDPAAAFDELPELLRLFDGLAASVERDAPAKVGAPKDRNKRAVLWELCVVFQDHGLPLAVGENSKLPKVARHLFRALRFEGDPRDILRTMLDEMRASGEMVRTEADTPATPEPDKPAKPRPLGWWGGELPE
jgi:hypothetical protein